MKDTLPITDEFRETLKIEKRTEQLRWALDEALFKLRQQLMRYHPRGTAILELLGFAERAISEKRGFLSIEDAGYSERISPYEMALFHIETAEKTLTQILEVYA